MAPSPNPDAVTRFWRNYLKRLEARRIPPNARPWYRNHVEGFLEASDQRLAQRTSRDLDRYLDTIGGQTSLEDWRFRQVADALRILFCDLVRAPWAKGYDWDRWISLSNRLPADHPTTARDTDASLNGGSVSNSSSSSHPGHFVPGGPFHTKMIAAVRRRGYSIKTEQTYLHWSARFLHFHGDASPDSLSGKDVVAFLDYLATERKVAVATQRIALNALAFLFNEVLERPFGDLGPFTRARSARRLPVVLSREEVQELLTRMSGQSRLMTALLYGTGMRLMECVRLRVLNRCGKGVHSPLKVLM